MIKTIDLTKKYGEMYAIRSINLDLAAGDLFGFIGPNGAGKTTTMRILATLLNPTWGEGLCLRPARASLTRRKSDDWSATCPTSSASTTT
jgi:ABC-type multidrug transport system ATPase subunit